MARSQVVDNVGMYFAALSLIVMTAAIKAPVCSRPLE